MFTRSKNGYTTKGIINGVVILTGLFLVHSHFTRVAGEITRIKDSGLLNSVDIIGFVWPLVLIGASVIFLTSKKHLLLNKFIPETKDLINSSVPFFVRANNVGVIPLMSSGAIASICKLLNFNFDQGINLSITLLLIIFFTYLFSVINISPQNIKTLLDRYGYSINNVNETDFHKTIDLHLLKTIFPTAVFLCSISIYPYIAITWLHMPQSMAALGGADTVVLCAIIIELIKNIREEKKLYETFSTLPVNTWTDVCYAETELEGDLITDILKLNGIVSVKESRRAICLTGSFAPWEICRPSYPSLSIHRQIGKGKIKILVPRNDEENAIKLLERYTAICPINKLDKKYAPGKHNTNNFQENRIENLKAHEEKS